MDDILAITRKIQALLNLAQNAGATEAEAANAAAKASAIAMKYGIDLAAVQTGGASKAIPVGSAEVFRADKYEAWVWDLLAGLAHANACKPFFINFGYAVSYNVVGSEVAVITIRSMMTYLEAAVLRLNRQAVSGRGLTMPQRRAFRAGFRTACARRIYRRIVDAFEATRTKDDAAKAAVGSTALVVADYWQKQIAEIDAWMAENMGDMKTRKSRSRDLSTVSHHEVAGAIAGKAAGDRVSLDAQLETAKEVAEGLITKQ